MWGFQGNGGLEMRGYLIRRVLNLVPTLVIVSMIVFAMIRILPGDPIYTLAAVETRRGQGYRLVAPDSET